MSDKTLKHFILMRFFPRQDIGYPHDVLDVDFLSQQLILAKNNALKSLNNQTNKDFELVFVVNRKFFSDSKYEFIFSTLTNAAAIPVKFIIAKERPGLIADALDKYDFVIQSGMDFDDFVYKDAIADTQAKVAECDNVLVYGYCKGYAYVSGELLAYSNRWKKRGHLRILQSLILKSSFAKTLPHVSIDSFNHPKIKLQLKEFLENNGVAFSNNMFQQNISKDAFIYFRHEMSHFNLVFAKGKSIEDRFQSRRKITDGEITKKYLEEEFGFYYDLNEIE